MEFSTLSTSNLTNDQKDLMLQLLIEKCKQRGDVILNNINQNSINNSLKKKPAIQQVSNFNSNSKKLLTKNQ